MFSEAQKVAAIRGLYGAVLSFALTTLTTDQATHSWQAALLTGGVAALTYLAARGGIEGWMDTVPKG